MLEVRGYRSGGPLSKDDFTELHHHLLVKLTSYIQVAKIKGAKRAVVPLSISRKRTPVD